MLERLDGGLHRFPRAMLQTAEGGSHGFAGNMGDHYLPFRLSGYSIDPATEGSDLHGQFETIESIIRGTVTGLEWQVGPDRDTNWYKAHERVLGLGDDWRMPTTEELQGPWDAGISHDSCGPFERTGALVWSGDVQDYSSALYFDFYDGGQDMRPLIGSSALRVFAVRSPNEDR
jgi:hypothetical protein